MTSAALPSCRTSVSLPIVPCQPRCEQRWTLLVLHSTGCDLVVSQGQRLGSKVRQARSPLAPAHKPCMRQCLVHSAQGGGAMPVKQTRV